MYAVILGAGEVGFHLTRVLAQEGHDVTVMDVHPAALERIEDALDVRTVAGDGLATELLDQIDIDRAALFLAVTDADEVNLLASAAAKQFGAQKTVARVGNRISGPAQHIYRSLLGIDLLLSSEMLAATEITKRIRMPGAVDVESFAHGKVQLRQLRITERSKLAGRPIRDVSLPPKTLIASLAKDDKILIPGGDDELEVGDEAIVIGETGALDGIEKLFGRQVKQAERIVIVGGGEIGFLTAQGLEAHGLNVRLIERDPRRSEWLAEQLTHTVVLHGDGTDLGLLKEARLDATDFFVAASGDDETNLMSGLLAKDQGARQAISVVDRPDYTSLYERLGIDHTISPRLMIADHILRFIRLGNVMAVAGMYGDRAEVLEAKTGPDSGIVGKPLSKVKLPRGVLVGAVVRGGEEVIVPRGDDTILPGDTVVLFCLTEMRPRIEKLL
jgi:trk system potassium uptake protein TrkA